MPPKPSTPSTNLELNDMKQIKTAEEILQHHYVHDRGLNNPEYAINAMRAYAEQFIDAAAEEILATLIRT